mmetsp:Transcript_98597/g.195608  ORF Transcript_98597/g.195608 Transcript_98597/m.195608 type:complete len:200 (+) Transcript_98597:1297-1896(+)
MSLPQHTTLMGDIQWCRSGLLMALHIVCAVWLDSSTIHVCCSSSCKEALRSFFGQFVIFSRRQNPRLRYRNLLARLNQRRLRQLRWGNKWLPGFRRWKQHLLQTSVGQHSSRAHAMSSESGPMTKLLQWPCYSHSVATPLHWRRLSSTPNLQTRRDAMVWRFSLSGPTVQRSSRIHWKRVVWSTYVRGMRYSMSAMRSS